MIQGTIVYRSRLRGILHIDWTINFTQLMSVIGLIITVITGTWGLKGLLERMNVRIARVEDWIKIEGDRYGKAIGVLDALGRSFERVTILYENMDKKVSRMDDEVDDHIKDFGIHNVKRNGPR